MSSHTAEDSGAKSSNSASSEKRPLRADWSAYATAYDLLSTHNPEYRALMHDFETFLTTIKAPSLVYDIGGGTGNYTEIAAHSLPGSAISLVEPDAAMLRTSQSKHAPYANVTFHNIALEGFNPPEPADLIVCVHALYAMPGQAQRLEDLYRLLSPGGHLYLIDLGRYMNVSDWRSYLFSELRKEYGLGEALRIFWQGRQVSKQNKAILKAQKSGDYWTHTGTELAEEVAKVGFQILRQQSVYRGYSDLFVCRKSP